jgi:hypothetical protein
MTQVIYTQDEVEDLLRSIGMGPMNARIGSAIAMCEAPVYGHGVARADFSLIGDIALADEVWGYSYGGFQIRSKRDQKGTGGWRDEDELLRPKFNARAAKAIKKAQGWNAWSTFSSGQFKAYLQDLYPPPPNTYVVLAGDSLSTIAQYLGCEWEDLARINGIHSPYTLSIGQYLTLP